MSLYTDRIELTVEHGDGPEMLLLAPAPGFFSCALERGRSVVPGQEAGVLLRLGRAARLVVPEGVRGSIVSERPEPVHAPVGHGQILYRLVPLDAAVEIEGPGSAAPLSESGGLVLGSPQSGRFYRRSSPDAEPYVSAGDVIEDGSPVGLIEVMKTFTHVPYRAHGGLPKRARIERVLVEDGEDVIEGQVLLEVSPEG